MKYLLIGFLGAVLGLNEVCAAAGPPANPASPQTEPVEDVVERAYKKLLAEDDAAQEEVDRWISEAKEARAKGSPVSEEVLNGRIDQRLAPVKKAYQEFLREHPRHVSARLAYGSFLYETLDEELGVEQWEKAREIDPKNAAAWNNLANHYGHRGPVAKAFEYYSQAIELKPDESVYLQNLATTTYVFRKDAMEFFKTGEKEVFDRSLELYRKALKLDPKNFPLATDYAQSYYGIKPLRTKEALAAWKYALEIANDDLERQGVYLHLARVELNSGMFDEARKHLGMVNNEFYAVLRDRLARNLAEKERPATEPTPAPARVKAAPETSTPQTATTPPKPMELFSIPHRSEKAKP